MLGNFVEPLPPGGKEEDAAACVLPLYRGPWLLLARGGGGGASAAPRPAGRVQAACVQVRQCKTWLLLLQPLQRGAVHGWQHSEVMSRRRECKSGQLGFLALCLFVSATSGGGLWEAT